MRGAPYEPEKTANINSKGFGPPFQKWGQSLGIWISIGGRICWFAWIIHFLPCVYVTITNRTGVSTCLTTETWHVLNFMAPVCLHYKISFCP